MGSFYRPPSTSVDYLEQQSCGKWPSTHRSVTFYAFAELKCHFIHPHTTHLLHLLQLVQLPHLLQIIHLLQLLELLQLLHLLQILQILHLLQLLHILHGVTLLCLELTTATTLSNTYYSDYYMGSHFCA